MSSTFVDISKQLVGIYFFAPFQEFLLGDRTVGINPVASKPSLLGGCRVFLLDCVTQNWSCSFLTTVLLYLTRARTAAGKELGIAALCTANKRPFQSLGTAAVMDVVGDPGRCGCLSLRSRSQRGLIGNSMMWAAGSPHIRQLGALSISWVAWSPLRRGS